MDFRSTDDCLLIFLDETGHETLPQGHEVFGFGGCAVMSPSLDHHVRSPWKAVRGAVTGSEDEPLHAAQFARKAKPGHFTQLTEFFMSGRFMRIGVSVSIGTELPPELKPFDAVAGALKNRIVEVVQAAPCREVALIFESSQRGNRLIEDAFAEFELRDGVQNIPVHRFFMEKTLGDAALEVADFVANAVHGQARRFAKGQKSFGKDFQAVFCSVPREFTSYINIASAEPWPTT